MPAEIRSSSRSESTDSFESLDLNLIDPNMRSKVFDWNIQQRDGEAFLKQPAPIGFKGLSTLHAYLNQPCQEQVVVRIIHTFNATAVAYLSPDMHLMGLLSSTTGLAFVNEASHRLDDHGGGGDDIGCNVFDVTCIDSSQGDGPHQGDAGTTKCAGLYFDYFKECTDDFPEVSEFIKSPEDQRCSESISWTEMELCPRRFSIALWHSSLPPNDSDQKSPLVTLLFMDSSSHADSWLPHPPLRIGRTLDKTMIDLAYNIVEGYMEFVSTRLGRTWSEVSWRANRHVRHLEDTVYSRPDHDSLSDDLWRASKTWLTLQRLARAHEDCFGKFEQNINETLHDLRIHERPKRDRTAPPEPTPNSISFSQALGVISNFRSRVEDDLMKPTSNLLDMLQLYKSIAIRNTRISLELNASLWRLSWITFIFLPLTFLSGFFGMNVDIFADNPSIKWYFIGATGVVVFSFLIWLGFKLNEKKQLNRHLGGYRPVKSGQV